MKKSESSLMGHATWSPARFVPPSPEVMATLFMDYKNSTKSKTMSFKEYLKSIGFTNPSEGLVGMDDRALFRAAPTGPQLIDIPAQAVTGEVRIKVLLVDFADRPGIQTVQHYEDLLFSEGIYPTGSMHDFYKEVSLGKIKITGSVHGWFRMPQPYSYYTNGHSGTKWNDYPHNAPRLAEDAVNAAKQAGVPFEKSLDKFNQGIITALIIIHSGLGAEVQVTKLKRDNEIWSHKWNFRNAVNVGPSLDATIYLTVPNDCKVGVCAHELGHLAFQWQDFYDPNYDEDGIEWDGSGVWDLMAGGSYNGSGARPAHPAGLHKLQHGWISSRTIKKSGSLTLRPYTARTGSVARIMSPAFKPKQYLLLENRKRSGFDFDLPGEGLLVWRVDEDGVQENPNTPGLFLIQADGRNDLTDPTGWNSGDAGDPFPGTAGKKLLKDSGTISTSFPGKRSGITIKNITRDVKGVIRLKIEIAGTGPSPVAKKKMGKKTTAKKVVAKKSAVKKATPKKTTVKKTAAKKSSVKKKAIKKAGPSKKTVKKSRSK